VTQLIDDQLLGAVLRGSPPPQRDVPLYTTGYFYVRLCQAVLASSTAAGVLSSPFNSLPHELRERATSALLELPEEIGLVSLRELGPVIGQLRVRHDLNILGMEALAAAVYLEADVYLSASSPRLEEALRRESRPVEVLA
jgi:hypothetical protein